MVIAALAIPASAVFFVQVLRPTSFLGAVIGSEYKRLLPPEKGKPRPDGGPTIQTIYTELDNRAYQAPFTARHTAVMKLFRAIIEVERGRRPASDFLAESESLLRADRDNSVTRLGYWVIADSAASGNAPGDRFAKLLETMEAPSAPRFSSFYNREFDELFREVLAKYIERPDVRANLAEYMDHFQLTEQFVVLPMIQNRILALAADLQSGGQVEQSQRCLKWMARTLLGLMEYEPDAGTRLLCADLAAQLLPHGDSSRDGLLKMRVAFHEKLGRSMADLTSISRSLVPDSEQYLSVIRRLFVAAALAAVSMGAAATLLASLGLALIRRSGVRPDSAKQSTGPAQYIGLAVAAGLAAWLGTQRPAEIHSELCISVWLVALFGTGVALPALLAGLDASNRISAKLIPACLLVIAFFGLASAKWASLAWPLRAIDLRGGAVVYLGIFVACTSLVVLIWPAASLKRIARSASLCWLTFMILALCGWAWFVSADGDYAANLAKARTDEISATLGEDWQAQYHIPKASVYDTPTATSSP